MASFARLGTAFLLAAAVGFPQKVASVRAGMVYHSEGEAAINGERLRFPSKRPPQVEDGQTITTAGGHTELLMGPNSVLWMRAGTRLRFDDTSLDHGRITVLVGSVMLEVKESDSDRALLVDTGGHVAELRQTGLYRFDAGMWRARVYAGEAYLQDTLSRLPAGREMTPEGQRRLDPEALDEFHWWAALRSLALEKESGRQEAWRLSEAFEGQTAKHAGFGITFPMDDRGAEIKYLAASGAGLIYEGPSDLWVGSSVGHYEVSLPLNVPGGDFIRSENGRTEVFLGVGAVAWINRGAQMRMVDTRAQNPAVAIEAGAVLMEIGAAKEAPAVHVRMGGITTELRRRGVYEADAAQHTLSVYDGEVEVLLGGRPVRLRAGERVNGETGVVTKFDAQEETPLLRWAAGRSFDLYSSQAGFMTGWKLGSHDREAQHRVFGHRFDSRVPVVRRERLNSGVNEAIDRLQREMDKQHKEQAKEDERRRQQQQQQ